MQLARRAFSRARAKTGNKIDDNIDIIAMTTKSSIKVNPLNLLCWPNRSIKISPSK